VKSIIFVSLGVVWLVAIALIFSAVSSEGSTKPGVGQVAGDGLSAIVENCCITSSKTCCINPVPLSAADNKDPRTLDGSTDTQTDGYLGTKDLGYIKNPNLVYSGVDVPTLVRSGFDAFGAPPLQPKPIIVDAGGALFVSASDPIAGLATNRIYDNKQEFVRKIEEEKERRANYDIGMEPWEVAREDTTFQDLLDPGISGHRTSRWWL